MLVHWHILQSLSFSPFLRNREAEILRCQPDKGIWCCSCLLRVLLWILRSDLTPVTSHTLTDQWLVTDTKLIKKPGWKRFSQYASSAVGTESNLTETISSLSAPCLPAALSACLFFHQVDAKNKQARRNRAVAIGVLLHWRMQVPPFSADRSCHTPTLKFSADES